MNTASKKKYPTFLAFIALFAIFVQPIFFSLAGLIGFQYGGAEEDPIYVRYVVMVFMAVLTAYLLSFAKKPKLSKTEFIFYFFFLFLISNHLVWALLDNETRLWNDNLIFFLSMGITGFFAARVIHVFDAWKEAIRLTEIVAIVMAIGLLVAIVQPFLAGFRIRGIGGATYQAASYYSAMCFGLLGIATFRLEREYRYRVCRTWIVNGVNVTLMIGLAVATVLNGGRGAFILLAFYILLVTYWIATKNGMTPRGLLRFSAVLIFLPIGLGLALHEILQNPILVKGFNRATAFIGSDDGALIDLEGGSSGRHHVYTVALQSSAESPWIGYGGFGHWEKVIQPHNLFLDLALQFGVPIALLLIFTVGALILTRLKRMNTEKVWLLTLSFYPLINLMFSSGYLRSVLFWFILAGIFFVGASTVHVKKRWL